MSVSSIRPAAVMYQPVTASCTALIEESPASCTIKHETTTMEEFSVGSIALTPIAAATATSPPSAWL